MRELFECRDCFHTGPLNHHLHCECCGSDQVTSQEVISAFSRGSFMSAAQYGKFQICEVFGIPAHMVGQA
jgi:hypothetical protein